MTALAGAAFAAAWAVRGGPTWFLSIVAVAAAGARAIGLYVTGGDDSDEGALAGSRADERQKLISLRSRGLAANAAMIVAFVGLTIAIAVRAAWWWPFLVILAVTGFAYLFGLSTHSVGEDPTDDVNAGHEARSPVSTL